MRNSVILIAFVLLAYGCVKDKPEPVKKTEFQASSSRKVFVVNEGNFGSSNAGVSLYDPGNKQVVEDIYKNQNSQNLGDVAQSMIRIQSKYYIAVNNSGKVVVCDENFKKSGEIKGLSSPRYILPVSYQKAYVSDLKANAVWVIDLGLNTVIKTVPLNGWSEQMALIYNKAFVTNKKKEYVFIINTINDQVMDSVFAGFNSNCVTVDKMDKVWVLSLGDPTKNINSKLSCIDPVTNEVLVALDFPTGASPHSLCLNQTRDTLYFVNEGIFRMSINDNTLPYSAFIEIGSRNFYGLGIDPNYNRVYASDALDYSQNSTIYVFDQGGNQVETFKAGVNASGFYFE